MVFQITTTVDDALYAEAKRRGISWARAVEAGLKQLIDGITIEKQLQQFKEELFHLKYQKQDGDYAIKEAIYQNELLKRYMKDRGIFPADIILDDRAKGDYDQRRAELLKEMKK